MHTTAEEKLWALADENPQQRSLVVLRPGVFMSNHFMADVHHIKHSNKLVSPCGSSSAIVTWIDTKGKQKEREYNMKHIYIFCFFLDRYL
jgi:hypothetical protein